MDVQRLRERVRVSQRELADLVGVTQSTVARWERGESVPTVEQRGRIVAKLRNQYLGAPLVVGARRRWVAARNAAVQAVGSSAQAEGGVRDAV